MATISASKIIKELNLDKGSDWFGLLEEMLTGNDRACAILGGVFLDEQFHYRTENMC